MVATPAPSTHAAFYFFDPASQSTSKPWSKVDSSTRSFESQKLTLPVYNARDEAGDFRDVDRTGFAYYTSPSSVSPETVLSNSTDIQKEYYAEIEAALKANLVDGNKVSRVILFDHTVRVHHPEAARQPVQAVHVDQTTAAAVARVRRHAGADAEELLKKRFQLINVWRPIGHPSSDFPLGVIDWRTASFADLVPTDLLYPKHDNYDGEDRGKETLPDQNSLRSTEGYEVRGETLNVKHSDGQRFYYVKDMTPDEVMFIKCFDSDAEHLDGGKPGLAGFTPHTAFIDPNTPADAKPRQSIEVRCLVFYE